MKKLLQKENMVIEYLTPSFEYEHFLFLNSCKMKMHRPIGTSSSKQAMGGGQILLKGATLNTGAAKVEKRSMQISILRSI